MLAARCPHCNATFKVQSEQLRVRNGRVRCGNCRSAFSALEHLYEIGEDGTELGRIQLNDAIDVPSSTAVAAMDVAQDTPQEVAKSQATNASPAVDATTQSAELKQNQAVDRATTVQAVIEPDDLTFEIDPLPSGVPIRFELSETAHIDQSHLEDLIDPILDQHHAEPHPNPLPEKQVESTTHAPRNESNVRDETSNEGQAGVPFPLFAEQPNGGETAAMALPPNLDVLGSPRANPFARFLVLPPQTWLWGCGILALIACLLASYVFRLELANSSPTARKILDTVFTVPYSKDTQYITIESSDLHPDPAQPAGFLFSSHLDNQASYPQAWPHLELTLTDRFERPVARRVFAPQEWLPAEKKKEEAFPARSGVDVSLNFAIREIEATGYRVKAFYP